MSVILGVDWGSTHLRVYRLEEGKSPQIRRGTVGARDLIGSDPSLFEKYFLDVAGDWMDEENQILVTGMATSKGAWCETRYLQCACDLRDLRKSGIASNIAGSSATFLSGICDPSGPDVMRGEELQLLGLASEGERRFVILPGTHSKWVELNGHIVTRFRTFMTGETFDFARHTALCGRLGSGDVTDEAAFLSGVERGKTGILNALFSARPRVLTGGMNPTGVSSYLSGVCLSAEINEAREIFDLSGKPDVYLFAEAELAKLYVTAFKAHSISPILINESATAQGFAKL